jgi:hypothetical protein
VEEGTCRTWRPLHLPDSGLALRHQIQGYDDEGGRSHQGVNLTQGNRQSPAHEVIPKRPVTTNPYCPTIGGMPSDDTPLKVQSGEELPTEKQSSDVKRASRERQATHRKMPSKASQSFTNTTVEKRVHFGRSKSKVRPQKHTHRSPGTTQWDLGNLPS